MIISIDKEKLFDKIQHSFIYLFIYDKKKFPENGDRGSILQHNKGHI